MCDVCDTKNIETKMLHRQELIINGTTLYGYYGSNEEANYYKEYTVNNCPMCR